MGSTSSVNAYVMNDRVVWSGPRDGRRFSLFSANVLVSEEEQPDRDSLGKQEPLPYSQNRALEWPLTGVHAASLYGRHWSKAGIHLCLGEPTPQRRQRR